MERLSTLTESMRSRAARITAGRWLQGQGAGKGSADATRQWFEARRDWADRPSLEKAAIAPMTSDDFPPAFRPMADAFLGAMAEISIPLQLSGLRRVPMRTRVYIDSGGVVAAEVTDGAVPVLLGNWSVVTMEPRQWGGINVVTDELIRNPSPATSIQIVDDLARDVAQAENIGFLSPDVPGSVLANAEHFTGSGAAVANVDADLGRVLGLVPAASLPGAAFTMTKETATALGLLRGSGGAAAYPNIGPQGGELLGLPVLISSACGLAGSPTTRIIAVLAPGEILWADEGHVFLTASREAALKMDNAPTSAAGNLISLWQTNSVATKAIRESSFLARARAAAYFSVTY